MSLPSVENSRGLLATAGRRAGGAVLPGRPEPFAEPGLDLVAECPFERDDGQCRAQVVDREHAGCRQPEVALQRRARRGCRPAPAPWRSRRFPRLTPSARAIRARLRRSSQVGLRDACRRHKRFGGAQTRRRGGQAALGFAADARGWRAGRWPVRRPAGTACPERAARRVPARSRCNSARACAARTRCAAARDPTIDSRAPSSSAPARVFSMARPPCARPPASTFANHFSGNSGRSPRAFQGAAAIRTQER